MLFQNSEGGGETFPACRYSLKGRGTKQHYYAAHRRLGRYSPSGR